MKHGFERVLLLAEQKELLVRLVEAWRRQPREDRQKFLMLSLSGGELLMHPGIRKGEERVAQEDIETLVQKGLLSGRYTRKDTIQFHITPEGFAYYEYLKASRDPFEQVELEMSRYVNAQRFTQLYPAASAKWKEAEELLWKDDSARHLTTVGHLCREAMQEFATALVERVQPTNASDNKAHDVNRITAVVLHLGERLGRGRTAFLNALIAYWGTVSDLVQRQEHAGAKEREPVTWEDARRTVFQTLVVFFEFDRTLEGLEN